MALADPTHDAKQRLVHHMTQNRAWFIWCKAELGSSKCKTELGPSYDATQDMHAQQTTHAIKHPAYRVGAGSQSPTILAPLPHSTTPTMPTSSPIHNRT
eukprot:1158108-Pelagomonas_calceolata.AAC.8